MTTAALLGCREDGVLRWPRAGNLVAPDALGNDRSIHQVWLEK